MRLAWAALVGMTGLLAWAQPEGPQTEEHPRGGHPQVPRPQTDWPTAKPEDVASIDAIVKGFYDSYSGPAGQPRDWDRFRSLFQPEARLVAARPGADGSAGAFFLRVSDYVDANRKYFEKGGLFDREVGRRVEQFGNIAHVWSTYETRHVAESPAPTVRGINSIQLLRDGPRWWIVNVYWDFERPESPIPERYLVVQKDGG